MLLTETPEARVRRALEEATAARLDELDPRPAHLAALAEAHRIHLSILLMWIHDRPRTDDYTAAAFLTWCEKWRLK